MEAARRTPGKGQPADAKCDALVVPLGSAVRDLPEYYGPWQSVYTRFRRWE
ncbi:transposase [Brevibacillus laterosporus]|nr:transposase [Brevibacillus laterosporus]